MNMLSDVAIARAFGRLVTGKTPNMRRIYTRRKPAEVPQYSIALSPRLTDAEIEAVIDARIRLHRPALEAVVRQREIAYILCGIEREIDRLLPGDFIGTPNPRCRDLHFFLSRIRVLVSPTPNPTQEEPA